jgi:N-methylhydantoinase A
MSLRTAVIGRRHPIALDAFGGVSTPTGPTDTRRVWFDDRWHDTPIHRREHLPVGATLVGPAIVEQLDTTTVIEPGDRARVDALGNLEIAIRGV